MTYKFNKEGDYIIYLISYNDLTNMSYMFYNCSSLKELNLSSFNTNQVTNMSYMFDNCSSLKQLDLSSFNTNQVNDMRRMFNNCSSLIELNISSFNTNKVLYKYNIGKIFSSINKSCKIKCKDEMIMKKYKDETGCIII